MTSPRPALTVILATDRFDTIRRVVECLQEQTVRDAIELVLIAPDRGSLELDESALMAHHRNRATTTMATMTNSRRRQ